MIKLPAFLLLLFLSVITSCDPKPYVKHVIKMEKESEGCSSAPERFRLISNFGGERYEFSKCLPADFSKDQVKVERRGDTVWLGFKEPSSSGNNILYNITVDIDSYPRYKFLGIDDEAYQIVYSN